MHPSRVVEALLWSGALGGAALAVVGWRAPMPAPPFPIGMTQVTRRSAAPAPRSPLVLTSAAALLAAYDPFRLTHQPALVAYGAPDPPPRVWAAPSGGLPSTRPHLVVQGFVGGRSEWAAVLGGVPGREGGVLVRAGDTLAGLRVRRITRDTLVVAAPDTAWHLTSGTGGVGGAQTAAAGALLPFGGRP
ncbi:hypothetical protein tb265_50060 [Gemmatimonadetes bacterium T265]|nr:hypothetical protein tb265_50060 [Gemmatimonadetes bacterium T265]